MSLKNCLIIVQNLKRANRFAAQHTLDLNFKTTEPSVEMTRLLSLAETSGTQLGNTTAS